MLTGTGDTALNSLTRRVFGRQYRHQTLPVAHRIGIAAGLVTGDTEQPEAGHFFRIGLQCLIGQLLQTLAPLLVLGKVLSLRPLAQQCRFTPGQPDRFGKRLGGIRGTLLRHVGTPEEIPAFRVFRAALHALFQTLGHLRHAARRHLRQLAGLIHLFKTAPVQVQTQTEQRHHQCGGQRQPLPQTALRGLITLGIGQQLASRFRLAGGQLFIGQRAGCLLRLQLGHPLLIERHVQGCTILFGLSLTTTQQGNQQKGQRHQQQQAGGQPEIDHHFLSSNWARRSRSSADSSVVAALVTLRRRRQTITPRVSTPSPSNPAGPYQSSRVLLDRGGL